LWWSGAAFAPSGASLCLRHDAELAGKDHGSAMAQAASLTTRDEQWAIQAIVHGHHHDPFSYLGMHQTADGLVVRTFLPHARVVTLIDVQGKPIAGFERIDPEGLFIAQQKGAKPFPYRLLVDARETEDPYRFPPLLGAMDFHLIAEGN